MKRDVPLLDEEEISETAMRIATKSWIIGTLNIEYENNMFTARIENGFILCLADVRNGG